MYIAGGLAAVSLCSVGFASWVIQGVSSTTSQNITASVGQLKDVAVSGSITSEILLIVSLVLTCLLLRHVHILLSGLVTLIVLVVLIKNMPLIPKFKIEQDDSLDKMIFYAVMVLGIVVVFVYWGGNLV